jgi:16S rRNA processing protein RimM
MRKVSALASSSSTDRILVGRVEKAHGLRGHVVVRSESDYSGRFSPGSSLQSDGGSSLVVETSSVTDRGILVKFAEVGDRSLAEQLAGTHLWIDEADRRPLAEDEFWPDQLVGLLVIDTEGHEVGSVTAVVEGTAQNRLVVSTSAGDVEVPFVAELVTDVDIAGGIVVVRAIEGLIEPQ